MGAPSSFKHSIERFGDYPMGLFDAFRQTGLQQSQVALGPAEIVCGTDVGSGFI